MHGSGRIFRRGRVWWIAFMVGGKEIRESSGSREKGIAKELLRSRLVSPPVPRKVTFDTVADDYLRSLTLAGRKSVRTSTAHLKHPRKAFGEVPASSVSFASLRAYQDTRLGEGAARATSDRETELVVSALRLAHRDGLLLTVPTVRRLMPRDANARQGFLSAEGFTRLLSHIRDTDFRDFLSWFWVTGMRVGEIGSLRWENLTPGKPPVLTLAHQDAKTGAGWCSWSTERRVVNATGQVSSTLVRSTSPAEHAGARQRQHNVT
jgi:hypothetical protein